MREGTVQETISVAFGGVWENLGSGGRRIGGRNDAPPYEKGIIFITNPEGVRHSVDIPRVDMVEPPLFRNKLANSLNNIGVVLALIREAIG